MLQDIAAGADLTFCCRVTAITQSAEQIGRVLRAGSRASPFREAKWFTDVTVREAVDAGLLEGPRMVVVARALSN